MAIDFPNAPTIGDEFSPPGTDVTWYWDGVKWTLTPAGTMPYLPLAGGTMTGDIIMSNSTEVELHGAAGTVRRISSYTGTDPRWAINLSNTTAENVPNTEGSDFSIMAFDDFGQPKTTFVIQRNIGVTVIGGGALTYPHVTAVAGDAHLILNTSGLSSRSWISGAKINVDRWRIQMPNNDTESTGTNIGSNFQIDTFNDVGVYLSTPLFINRATGKISVNAPGIVTPLSLSGNSGEASIALNKALPVGPINFTSNIAGYRNSITRWSLALGNNDVESGANSGSNFSVSRYDDAGAIIDSPILIARDTGITTLSNIRAPQAIGKNILINGSFNTSQYNASNAYSVPAGGGYGIDRWYGQNNTVSIHYSVTRIAPVVGDPLLALGFNTNARIIALGAYASPATGDAMSFMQRIECNAIIGLCWGTANAKPVTLSFYVRPNQLGPFSFTIKNFDATRSYVHQYTAVPNIWNRIEVTIPGDTGGVWYQNSGQLLGAVLYFDLCTGATFTTATTDTWLAGNFQKSAGSANVFQTNGSQLELAAIKLEQGIVATPWPPYDTAVGIIECQRYYQIFGGAIICYTNTTGSFGGAFCHIPFLVQMRVTPTITQLTITPSINPPWNGTIVYTPFSSIEMQVSAASITLPTGAYATFTGSLSAEL